MSVSIALAAGGTGGHLLPALAVASAIRERRPDARLLVIGSQRQLDSALLREAGLDVASTDVAPFAHARQVPSVLRALWRATDQAATLLREHEVRTVLGFGGYASLPAVLAARRAGATAMVHEANALPKLGLANRIGAWRGARVFTGFPAGAKPGSHELVGVPLRPEIAELEPIRERAAARSRSGLPPHLRTVLIMGGSLGARRINDAAIAWAKARDPSTSVLLSTGENDHARVRDALADADDVVVQPFIQDMASAYAAAEVVVSRAGGLTVAELESLGIPAILVPLPIARADEQTANARILVQRNQGRLIRDADLDAQRLSMAVAEMLAKPMAAREPRHATAAGRLAEASIEAAERSHA